MMLTALSLTAVSLGWLSSLSSAYFTWAMSSPTAAISTGLVVLCAALATACGSLVKSTYLDAADTARGRRRRPAVCRLLSLALFVGQLGLSWQSSFHDLMAYIERDERDVIRGKLRSLRFLVLAQYALAAPLFAAIVDGGLVVASCFAIFNSGCVPPVGVWISLSNSRRIDPFAPAFFSQEGSSSALESSLGTAGLVAIPLLLSLALPSETAGLIAIAAVGATSIVIGPAIERRLAALYRSRRYVLAHRLRQRS
ncbi:MAG TPA: DUF5687 family protein [Acidobacteriota bacterium]|nr:DUF5687 family protein [Acidobacteriota bacterium]